MPRKMTFVVTLSEASTETATLDYATVPGSATAPDDYTHTAGTLTFDPGEITKHVVVPVRDDFAGAPREVFSLQITNPEGCTIEVPSGTGVIPGVDGLLSYRQRFDWIYAAVHDTRNGYFGPQTGANAFAVPRHVPENIINEAPDYGGETVSETASFWVGLEAWQGALNADWTGYNNCWNKIDTIYVPNTTNQPAGTYNPASPADYTPEGNLPSDYPRLSQPNAAKGVDPLYQELLTTYGSKRMYLMHWIIDVEGAYGFKNGDGATKNVYINTYERGLQESSFETVTHPCWNDWNNGGSAYGYEPLFTQGKQLYPAAQYDWGKKWSYTNAPDAEVRAVQWAFWANKFAADQGAGATIATSTSRAKKMGDYLRYNLFDKYFRQIGANRAQGGTSAAPYSSCHYLINWYAAWGGEVPAAGAEASWGYRIGCSEAHQGYQGVDTAYFMATGGGGFTPQSASAGDIWLGSLYRQIEMIRWLQSPEGPIAGGVTNSLFARYETATDGRQNAKFYGMYYTYAPVWHDPPSNNWVGFQPWGQARTADAFLEVSDKTTALAVEVRKNLEVILDRLVNWFLDESELIGTGDFKIPGTLSWVNSTAIAGQTATTANLEGVYEYLPTLEWDGTGDYAAFWNASTVPNPTLHCKITEYSTDLGVASSLAVLLINYAEAKRRMGKFTDAIPGGAHTAEDAYMLARELLDRVWTTYRDDIGICTPEPRSDYKRMLDPVYVPAIFNGTMPNGDVVNSASTYISIRSFLKDDPMWPVIEAHAADPVANPAPVFTYHRFWAQAEYAIACAAMHHYFGDLIGESD
ncbi:Calx-beta domain-containing protein [Novosphingobium sp. PhB55]|uniref:glycoside hydrolase family 48 protein n=1 Tax=Novosphingobium sp. PhB55 TaxID=2485106 RepID=UPI001065D39B|nr:glycoside hydrolase family 48 protein [Novosphingobium sp. PhB55]TDW63098.1 Calx-beta domain-containing protein [Novosphingobium sp. PhB55]